MDFNFSAFDSPSIKMRVSIGVIDGLSNALKLKSILHQFLLFFLLYHIIKVEANMPLLMKNGF
jgi:hypothetical protein